MQTEVQETVIELLVQELKHKDNLLTHVSDKLTDESLLVRELTRELTEVREKAKPLVAENSRNLGLLQSQQLHNQMLTKQVSGLQDENKRLKEEVQSLRTVCSELESDLFGERFENGQYQNRVKELEAGIEGQYKELTRLNKSLENCHDQIGVLGERNVELSEKLKATVKYNQELEDKLTYKHKEISEHLKVINDLQDKLNQDCAKIVELKKAVDNTHQFYRDTRLENEELKAQLALAEGMADKLQDELINERSKGKCATQAQPDPVAIPGAVKVFDWLFHRLVDWPMTITFDEYDRLIEGLKERKAFGLEKYGVTMQVPNGDRDLDKDLQDELLDAMVYTAAKMIAEPGQAPNYQRVLTDLIKLYTHVTSIDD